MRRAVEAIAPSHDRAAVPLPSARALLRAEARLLELTAERLGDDFSRAVELLRGCRGRVVTSGVGASGPLAQCMAAALTRAGVPSFFLHAADAAHGDVGAVSRSDVALLVSTAGTPEELMLLVPYLDELDVPVVAIVPERRSPLGLAASAVLCTDVGSALASLALVEALAHVIRGAGPAR
jgi:arabinose-5-phosphate isomerase